MPTSELEEDCVERDNWKIRIDTINSILLVIDGTMQFHINEYNYFPNRVSDILNDDKNMFLSLIAILQDRYKKVMELHTDSLKALAFIQERHSWKEYLKTILHRGEENVLKSMLKLPKDFYIESFLMDRESLYYERADDIKIFEDIYSYVWSFYCDRATDYKYEGIYTLQHQALGVSNAALRCKKIYSEIKTIHIQIARSYAQLRLLLKDA